MASRTVDLTVKIADFKEVQDAFKEIRHRTFFEAAQAVCDHCNIDIPVFDDSEGLYRHSSGMKCAASRIYERDEEG